MTFLRYHQIPAMMTILPKTACAAGISLKKITARIAENTGSASLIVLTVAALKYFNPQLKILWPRRVLTTAMPSVVSQLTGSYPRTGVPLISNMASEQSAVTV